MWYPSSEWPLWLSITGLAFASVVILFSGVKLTSLADRLADRTGLGEAATGAILLGASTSLPGIVTSITAAWHGHAELAVSNGIGGIAAQTTFLGIADITNREANLEHQAVSVPNMIYATLLIMLLGGVLLASNSPDFTIWGVHPITPLLAVAYLFGLRLARIGQKQPQWEPRQTEFTRPDVPDEEAAHRESLTRMWVKFGMLALILGVSGWVVARTGENITARTGLSQSVVGGLFTAISTSTPELVTSVAAVRRGALTLAVGGVIGGNAFDVMFVVAADIAFREGSIYHAISPREHFLTTLAIVMSAVLVMGLLSREKRGIANIGYESFLILTLYAAGWIVLGFMGAL
ncbi:MAG: cation transporter [Phycisphaerae bacterium]